MLTEQQNAVVDWTKAGEGNALVRALAGTGKTHLLMHAMAEMKGDVCYVVYARKNSVEAKAKAAKAGLSNVTVSTFHAAGWRAWRDVYPKCRVDENKLADIIKELAVPDHLHGFVRSAVSLGRQRAIGIVGALFDEQAWLDLVDHFGLEDEIPEDTQKKWPGDQVRVGLNAACKAIRRSIELAPLVCDFDDMLYMPLRANIRMRQYDWLCVDEAQDSNPARRAMARRMLKIGGRAIFVGDENQAIFGFTGADNDSLTLIKSEFGTEIFPLTVTFRCPKAVVEMARNFVPTYEAAATNAVGEVQEIDDTVFATLPVGGDDAIICRNTRPLVKVAYSLIRRGIPAHIEGREIGKGLLKLIGRWNVTSISVLLDKLDIYREKQVAKLMAKGREAQAEALADRVETIVAITEGLPPGSRLLDLRNKIESMFADSKPGERSNRVTLMTAHRSKGMEFKRVFIWGRRAYMPSRYARQDWQRQQERHIEYVAITRAMETLVDVRVTQEA